MPGHLYIHIPFCLRRCLYCDFHSGAYSPELARRYTGALVREIMAAQGGELETVYIGGGTPSALGPELLGRIAAAVRERFTLSGDAEFTVEANPAAVDADTVRVLMPFGLNRVSLGVQSFDDRQLAALGRAHNSREAMDAIVAISGLGLRLSMDLMYGLPGQSRQSWLNSLEMAVEPGPGHVSAYELTLEQGTPLYADVRAGRVVLPSEDETALMYEMAGQVLCTAGLAHYEISNYALPGQESRHNLNYWQRGGYIGMGSGAHGFANGVRTVNLPDVAGYIEALESGCAPPRASETPTHAEAAREYVFLGLRSSEGLDAKRAREEFALELERACGPATGGICEMRCGRLRLTPRGMAVYNSAVLSVLKALGL